MDQVKIVTFYQFKNLEAEHLLDLKTTLRDSMRSHAIKGTIILAAEGFNSTICGISGQVDAFISRFEDLLDTKLDIKSSFHDWWPFRRAEVKIKPEIVTLKKDVNIKLGHGTHVSPEGWNEIITDPETIVLDARNDYEIQTGSFASAINPKTKHFSQLPEFVDTHLDPRLHKKVAMFCTGGIRCEKFAPYLRQLGFENVYQLQGGILRYLEEIKEEESLWDGECFVFDTRVSVDSKLKKGVSGDHSQKASE